MYTCCIWWGVFLSKTSVFDLLGLNHWPKIKKHHYKSKGFLPKIIPHIRKIRQFSKIGCPHWWDYPRKIEVFTFFYEKVYSTSFAGCILSMFYFEKCSGGNTTSYNKLYSVVVLEFELTKCTEVWLYNLLYQVVH